jgi:hypothetical protein
MNEGCILARAPAEIWDVPLVSLFSNCPPTRRSVVKVGKCLERPGFLVAAFPALMLGLSLQEKDGLLAIVSYVAASTPNHSQSLPSPVRTILIKIYTHPIQNSGSNAFIVRRLPMQR